LELSQFFIEVIPFSRKINLDNRRFSYKKGQLMTIDRYRLFFLKTVLVHE